MCYTNHALDQFILGMTKFTTKIVRVGGRCGAPELDAFSLHKLKETAGGRRDKATGKIIWSLSQKKKTLDSLLETALSTMQSGK